MGKLETEISVKFIRNERWISQPGVIYILPGNDCATLDEGRKSVD